jgi:hypothetical protein
MSLLQQGVALKLDQSNGRSEWSKFQSVTLLIRRFPEECAGLVTECNRSIYRSDSGLAVSEVSLELMHIVDALPSASCVLAKYRSHAQSPCPHTQDKRILRNHMSI